MSEQSREQNEHFGRFVVQFGNVSEAQLSEALELWRANRSRPLGECLVATGAIDSDSRKSLEMLFGAYKLADFDEELAAADATSAPTDSASEPDELATEVAWSEDTHPAPAPAGKSDGRFLRKRLHAEGGLGKIYEAYDRDLNREVALKEIKPQYVDVTESRERFVNEAEITGRLEHPGIVPVYALGNDPDGRPYYTMRMVRGRTLQRAVREYFETKQWDRTGRALAMRRLLTRFCEVCDAIYYAHRRGVIHRDIKPSNIMLGDYGETFVLDWGLAKTLGKREQVKSGSLPEEKTLLTSTGSTGSNSLAGRAIGSPAYMSPEQARGDHDEVTFSSDIYGLGATLYVILTGVPPVEGGNPAEILTQVRKGSFLPPRKRRGDVPVPLDAVCQKAMAFEAEDRYASVKELRADIDRYLADEPVLAYRESAFDGFLRLGRRVRWLYPLLVLSLTALLGAGYFWARMERSEKLLQQAVVAMYDTTDPFKAPPPDVINVEYQRLKALRLSDAQRADIYERLAERARAFQQPGLGIDVAREAVRLAQVAHGNAHPNTRQAMRTLAGLLGINGQRQEAIAVLSSLVDHSGSDSQELVSGYLHDLGSNYMEEGDLERALDYAQQALAIREPALGAKHAKTINTKQLLGQIMLRQGKHDEAIRILTDVVNTADEDQMFQDQLLSMKSNLGYAHQRKGDHKTALDIWQQLLPEYERLLGPSHENTVTLRLNIAGAERELGQLESSITNMREVVETRKTTLGADHPHTWYAELSLARSLLAGGHHQEAADLARPALAKYRPEFGYQRQQTAGYRDFAFALLALGTYDEIGDVIANWREHAASDVDGFDLTLASGEAAVGLRDAEQAARVIEKLRAIPALTDVQQAGIDSLQGALFLSQARYNDAEPYLLEAEKSLRNAQQLQAYQRFWYSQVCQRLADTHEGAGRPEEAEKWRQASADSARGS